MSGRFKFFPFGFREFSGQQVNEGLRWAAWAFQTVAASDETTPLIPANPAVTFRIPEILLDEDVRASLTTASTAGPVTVDVQADGVSILSSLISIAEGAKTGSAPLTQTELLIPDNAEITVHIVAAGATAAGLKVMLLGRRQTR